MTHNFQLIAKNFVRWGEACDNLRAALIIGSQARTDHRADEYSDLDIIMIVDNPNYFLSSDQWLRSIGDYHISFVENTIDGGKERRVLFDNALDVDFVMIPESNVNALNDGEAVKILERGYHILIDKIGLQAKIKSLGIVKPTLSLPAENEFLNIVNDFWFHSVWTAKKLKRGELWTAMLCVDSYMKRKLLSIIEYYAQAVHGADYNTWHSGRFIEEWAEKWITEKLSLCFSHYNKENIKNALLSTMDLFRSIAIEIAKKFCFQYPKEADEYATAWVTSVL